MLPLEGVLVVAIEQAVAAPLCTSRLCEAGARVIKIERESGDFARGYDSVAGGDSSYFLWLNRGKESLVLDFKNKADAELLNRILQRADVLVQNLAPGALDRAGFGSEKLRKKHPGLITCDISGYGSADSVVGMKAYDLLVQAESGLISISGGKSELGRIGVSMCDISAGMNAHAGILEALIERGRTGKGKGIEVSLFGTAADWMTVPLLHQDYGNGAPGRAGLHHPSIAPYGGYETGDGNVIIVAIQNEREWARFCQHVLDNTKLAKDSRFASNNARVENRTEMDKIILDAFAKLDRKQLIECLKRADVAFGSVNNIEDLSTHSALVRQSAISSDGNTVDFPARPILNLEPVEPMMEKTRVPAIGQHSSHIREEFKP